jgi:hypothetical protein
MNEPTNRHPPTSLQVALDCCPANTNSIVQEEAEAYLGDLMTEVEVAILESRGERSAPLAKALEDALTVSPKEGMTSTTKGDVSATYLASESGSE